MDSHKSSMDYKLPALGTYFSPPEQPKMGSFSESNVYAGQSQSSPVVAKTSTSLPSVHHMLQTASPPISPLTQLEKEVSNDKPREADDRRDPVLYPTAHPTSSASNLSTQRALFSHTFNAANPRSKTIHVRDGDAFVEVAKDDYQQVIRKHMHKQKSTAPRSRPSEQEYSLVAEAASANFRRFQRDPQAYIKRELEWLQLYPPRFPMYKYPENKPMAEREGATTGTKRKASTLTTSQPTKRSKVAVKAPVEKLPSVKRVRKSPRENALDSFDADLPSPPFERKVVPRTTPHKDDTDFDALPDYSPPLSSLPDNGKALKTDWRGHPLDLSNDPHKHLLHPAEIGLASTLRLTCAQYLCSKRRIFEGRLQSLRNKKEFRKTTAQQACKIDVNKASKLWAAFDKVGWFDPKYIQQYL